ncbi:MAG: hypothetical protein KatS3mg105_3509 [Gemmatales bacterium]|nr:MAG: hypothetical protein KatS3mg105_3509 [Gemmatales bacterium]
MSGHFREPGSPANADVEIPLVLPVGTLPEIAKEASGVGAGGEPGETPGLLRRFWLRCCSIGEWIFGAISLIVGLAVVAAVPIAWFLSLGYLLEAARRVATSGKLRTGFIGIRPAARAGSMIAGAWIMLLPLRLLSSMAVDAELIDPGGVTAERWRLGLTLATILVVIHIVAACSRGGKLRYFFWPFNLIWLVRRLRQGGYFSQARDAVWEFLRGMRLPYFFWLGLRGFCGAFVWLAVPITVLALGRFAPVVGFIGGAMLAIVLLYVPFLQMRFAVENRFSSFWQIRPVRDLYRRAPWAFAFAFFITLLFAVPLYLLKIEMIPRETAWLPSLVFIVFIFPARLLTGWAYARASRCDRPRHWFFRWTGRLWMLPVAAIYVLIVFFTQYLSWGGVWSLYEQHAFLLPMPFVGM